MPGVFPDYPAPVVRNSREGREIVLVRLGHAAASEDGRPAVINIRNTSSPHWCGWPKPETRGLVPFNSFAEYAPEPNPETKKKDVVWFALSGNSSNIRLRRRLDRVQGDRGTKSKPLPGPHLGYGFLTTKANAVVAPIHPKGMPVILTTDKGCSLWLFSPWDEAKALQQRCRMRR